MSASKSDIQSEDLSGRVVVGTVTKVFPFGALLKLPDSRGIGFLHVSQVSDKRLDPPLTDTLKEGDKIEVLAKWFDAQNGRWETSHKAIIHQQRWESGGLTKPGTRFSANVLKASELGALVDIDGVRGSIFAGRTGSIDFFNWNAYDVLYEAGYLKPDSSVEVVVDGWEVARGQPRLRLYLGEPQKISRGTVHDGEVILLRKNIVKHRMRDYLFAKLGGGEIVVTMPSDLLDAEKTFPLGSTIPLAIGRYRTWKQMLEAKIGLPPRDPPKPGTVVDAKVVRVLPIGAICLISDRLSGLLHHSTIIQEKSGDTRRHLHPGDLVRVVVMSRPDDPRIGLEFLQLVDRTLDAETTENNDLIDLRASRRLGRPSGFQRDQDFRWNVLEAFDHTCCVCGVRHVFGGASAMEAAHIIPRARRGVDAARNSLCLCSLHHWAFDKGFLTIDENFHVLVARQIIDLGDQDSALTKYHGKKIHVTDPTIVSVDAIQWHRENVFLD